MFWMEHNLQPQKWTVDILEIQRGNNNQGCLSKGWIAPTESIYQNVAINKDASDEEARI